MDIGLGIPYEVLGVDQQYFGHFLFLGTESLIDEMFEKHARGSTPENCYTTRNWHDTQLKSTGSRVGSRRASMDLRFGDMVVRVVGMGRFKGCPCNSQAQPANSRSGHAGV